MANEPEIIADFPKCRDCGSTKKVSQRACADLKAKGKIAQDAFTSLRQQLTPLEQPTLAGVMVQAIDCHFDVCGKCGKERCTRATLINVPVQVQGMPGAKIPGQMRPPFLKG